MLNKWINRWSNESYLRINDNTGVCYRIWGYYFPVKHKSCDSFVPVLPLKNVLENELVMEESINVVTCLYKSELMQIIFSQLVYSSVVSDSAPLWTAVRQASLSINSQSLLNPCPLSQWCHPNISSSVVPFSACLQSFPASGSFQMSSSSHQVAKVLADYINKFYNSMSFTIILALYKEIV